MKKVEEKINTIRKNAGNPMVRCPICLGSEWAPYIRIVNGKIVEGCIDAFHLKAGSCGPGNYADWYWRPIARKLRRNELKRIS